MVVVPEVRAEVPAVHAWRRCRAAAAARRKVYSEHDHVVAVLEHELLSTRERAASMRHRADHAADGVRRDVLSAEVARLERRESEIAGLAQSAARTPPSPPRGGRASPARTFSPARRADPSEAGAGADLNC